MRDNLPEIKEKIAKKSEELTSSIENDEDENIITKKSVELDNLIIECLRSKSK